MATIQDIAKRAGVSVSTVSYALSGKRPISEETRQRILKVVDELDYHPHALARGLASRHSRTIGLLYPSETNSLSEGQLDVVLNAVSEATRRGYPVMLWSSPLNEEEIWRLIRQNLLEGVILAEIKRQDPRVTFLKEKDYPFVMIGRCEQNEGLSFIDMDFCEALRVCVNHLADLGHQRIVFINASPDLVKEGFNAAVCSLEGFEQAMEARGLQGSAYTCKPTPRHANELMAQILRDDPQTSAVITIIDRVVPGILEALRAAERNVPQDFSLVTIFSRRIAEMSHPPLTGVAAPIELGKAAMDMLIKRLEYQQEAPVQILLPPEFVVRESTAVCRFRSPMESRR